MGEGELTVGEHGRARVSEGERSPSSRELEGEGGEGFYIAQTGKPADLHVSGGYLDNFCLDLSGMFPVLIEMLQDLGMQKAETNAKPLGRHCMCSFLGS